MASQYIVIGKESCPFCSRAKQLLESKEIEYTYRDVQQVNSADVAALEEIAGAEFRTVPQIFKYKEGGGLDYIGGFTELQGTFNES
jgi:glutaredoxin